MTTLRLYRGIAVPAASAADVTSSIRRVGLIEREGARGIGQISRLAAGVSVEEAEMAATQVRNACRRPAVCASGTLEGAEYYAWQHNRFGEDNTPLLIEFEADLKQVAIDAPDFLYPAFQGGDPEKARSILENLYGDKILKYADAAWALNDQLDRLALCDLATLDPDVVLAHYSNRIVIGGKHGTTFASAFTVAFPVQPEAIVRVWAPVKRGVPRSPSLIFRDTFPDPPSQPPITHPKEEQTPRLSIYDIADWKYGD